MKTYIITDTHFGHDNIIRYCGRPEDHETRILDSIKKIEGPGLLIHLGDVAFKSAGSWNRIFNDELPAGITSVLIRGNHDMDHGYEWYLDHGWDFVCESLVMSVKDYKVVLSHFPVNRVQFTNFNIHGHLHTAEPTPVTQEGVPYDKEYHKKLAIEEVGYKPVLIEDFLKI